MRVTALVGLMCRIGWFYCSTVQVEEEAWQWKCLLLHRSIEHGPFLVLSDLQMPGKIPMATSQWPGLVSSTVTLILFPHKENTLASQAFPEDMEFYQLELQQCDLLRERPGCTRGGGT